MLQRFAAFVQKHPVAVLAASIATAIGVMGAFAAIWQAFSHRTVPEVVRPILSGLTMPPFYPYWLITLAVLVAVGQGLVIWAYRTAAVQNVALPVSASVSAEAEATPLRPRVYLHAAPGSTVHITLRNVGAPFKLSALLVVLSGPDGVAIDRPGPHEYISRPVGGGDGFSHFDIAQLDTYGHSVSVWTEPGNRIQVWEIRPGKSLVFRVGMIFRWEQGKRGELYFERLASQIFEITATRTHLAVKTLPWDIEGKT